MATYYVVAKVEAESEEEVREYFDNLTGVDGFFWMNPDETFKVVVTKGNKVTEYDADGMVLG